MVATDDSFVSLLTHQAQATPHRLYARFNGVPITFGEVDRASSALARWLREQGLAPGDRAAVMLHNSPASLAVLFGLGVATVVKWWQRYRATGDVAAKPRGGSQVRALVDERDWLLERVAAEPHVTTRALAGELAERGREVSHVSVWNLLRRERLTHKKNRARQRAGSS